LPILKKKSLVFCDQEQKIFHFAKFHENLRGWINVLDQLTWNDPTKNGWKQRQFWKYSYL